MSEVEVVRTGNIFYTSWPKGHEWDFVKMKFSRFEPGSGKSQELKAELLVEALGKQPHNTRVTLTAGRSVNEAAKRCNDEIPGIPWGSIMSEACNGVKESYREGEPVIRLADMAETEASQYLLDPFLLQKQANLIYGDGGLGKSWFALYLGVLVATGKSHAGISPEPGNVMYLDYEVPDFDMKSRLAAVCRGLDVPEPKNFLYRYMYDSTVGDQERLMELVAEHDTSLLIIDSAGPASGGRAEESAMALQYYNALRAMNCTTLTIAHVSKTEASEKGTSTPFGSVFWRNMARNTWEIRQGATFTKAIKEFGVFQTKLNSGAGEAPRAFRLTYDNPRRAINVKFEAISTDSNEDFVERYSARDKIIWFIKDQRREATKDKMMFEGVTAKEMAEHFSERIDTFNTALSRGSKVGLFASPSRGLWDLKDKMEEDMRLIEYNPGKTLM